MEKDVEIAPREVAELLKQGKIKLLDVRTPQEYAIASIPGSVLVDQSVAQEILQWPKDTEIVTICHHGMRSLDACAYLRGHGFTNTKSMTGGIEAWHCRWTRATEILKRKPGPEAEERGSPGFWLPAFHSFLPTSKSRPRVIFPNTLRASSAIFEIWRPS